MFNYILFSLKMQFQESYVPPTVVRNHDLLIVKIQQQEKVFLGFKTGGACLHGACKASWLWLATPLSSLHRSLAVMLQPFEVSEVFCVCHSHANPGDNPGHLFSETSVHGLRLCTAALLNSDPQRAKGWQEGYFQWLA